MYEVSFCGGCGDSTSLEIFCKCREVCYCSEECQKTDLKNHTLLCGKELYDVLKVIFNYHKIGFCDRHMCSDEICLFLPSHDIITFNEPYRLQFCNPIEKMCNLCGVVRYGIPSKDQYYSFFKDKFNVKYYICIPCKNLKYSMCPRTFKNRIYCFHEKILTLMISLHKNIYIWLPPEIIKLIIQTCILIKCCGC